MYKKNKTKSKGSKKEVSSNQNQSPEPKLNPNFKEIIDLSKELLGKDCEFKSLFNIDETLKKGFGDLSEKDKMDEFFSTKASIGLDSEENEGWNTKVNQIPSFIGNIRNKDVAPPKKNKCLCVLIILLLVGLFIPFGTITVLWYEGKISLEIVPHFNVESPKCMCGEQNKETDFLEQMKVLSFNNNVIQNDNGNFRMEVNESSLPAKQEKGVIPVQDRATKARSYVWMIILLAIIVTIAFLAIMITVIHVLKRQQELTEERERVLLEHQNKIINEYVNVQFSMGRLLLHDREVNLSYKEHYGQILLDRMQKVNDWMHECLEITKKQQEKAWDYKNQHLKAKDEVLKNLCSSLCCQEECCKNTNDSNNKFTQVVKQKGDFGVIRINQ